MLAHVRRFTYHMEACFDVRNYTYMIVRTFGPGVTVWMSHTVERQNVCMMKLCPEQKFALKFLMNGKRMREGGGHSQQKTNLMPLLCPLCCFCPPCLPKPPLTWLERFQGYLQETASVE